MTRSRTDTRGTGESPNGAPASVGAAPAEGPTLSRRTVLAAAPVLAAGGLFAARSAPAQAAAQADGGTLTASFFGSTNPWTSGGSPQGINLLFNRLIEVEADYQTLVPALAESWEASEDGLTYTFTLRQDVSWHDGEPFTSADVIFSLQTLMDPQMGGWLPAASVYPIQGARAYHDGESTEVPGLRAIDDYTVEITAEEPTATFLGGISAAWILPRHLLEEVPVDELATDPFFSEQLIGTGSYMLQEFVPDQHLILTRNPSFFRGEPQIETIVIRKIDQPGVAILGQQRGEFDIIHLTTPDDIALVEADPNLTVWAGPLTTIISFTTNVGKPYLSDKRVRQALVYAIDRETIVDALWKGAATIINSPIVVPWVDQSDINPYPYDPDRARQLLDEAGWDANQSIELMMEYTDEFHRRLAAAIQQYWQDVEINATIRQAEWSSLEPDVTSGNYDLLYGGQAGGIDPNDCAIYYTSASEFNKLIRNPELDRLFAEGLRTLEQEERAEIYKQVALILNEESYWPVLWAPKRVWAARTQIRGVVNNLGSVGYHRPFTMAEETWTIEQ